MAQGDGFVRAKDHGLESVVSQGGTNVSGGQRQRLCIARALVAQPKVYLFDDSFSALDVATDARLRAALKGTTKDATVIIVAQRVSTIIEADQILVMEHGQIVARGTHEQLLESSETYQEIVNSQDRGGGSGMSPDEKPSPTAAGPDPVTAPTAAAAAEAEAEILEEQFKPGEADGDMTGTPANKAQHFWPSAKRLFGLLKPEKASIALVLAMVVVAVVLNVIAPKVLGNAMDVIFNGAIGMNLPAGASQAEVIAGLRAQGQDQFADLLSGMELVPGVGIDFQLLGNLILLVLGMYVVSSLFMWLQGWLLNRIVMRVVSTCAGMWKPS